MYLNIMPGPASAKALDVVCWSAPTKIMPARQEPFDRSSIGKAVPRVWVEGRRVEDLRAFLGETIASLQRHFA